MVQESGSSSWRSGFSWCAGCPPRPSGGAPRPRRPPMVPPPKTPAAGTPRIAITYVEILYPIPGDLCGDDITISFRITTFTLVRPGRRESVPNEGRVRVLVDGLVFKDLTSYEPAYFSDLSDGYHTV